MADKVVVGGGEPPRWNKTEEKQEKGVCECVRIMVLQHFSGLYNLLLESVRRRTCSAWSGIEWVEPSTQLSSDWTADTHLSGSTPAFSGSPVPSRWLKLHTEPTRSQRAPLVSPAGWKKRKMVEEEEVMVGGEQKVWLL